MKGLDVRPTSPSWKPALSLPAALVALLFFACVATAGDTSSKDTCVDCHSDANFLVTNKSLHDYYRQWKGSVHEVDGVSCFDCHGGNRQATDKDEAHSEGVGGGADASSAVNFRRVPETCGQCHGDIYDAFLESEHSKQLVDRKDGQQGPNCVTCHGSLNASVLSVTTVENTCSECHNADRDNNPDIPERARAVLNLFQSIQRYYRYIGVRGEPAETQQFVRETDKRVRALSELWHTFDMDEIEKQTRAVVASVKAKRMEIAENARAKTEAPEGSD